jgi:cytochrome c6
MKKVLSLIVAAIALFTLTVAHPALADVDTKLGAKVFSANCAACHMGGGNVVAGNKNLKAETLKQYGMDSADAIINQVKNGKNAMPAFKGRLSDDEIESVAAYVLDQSTKDWKK